MSSLWIRVDQTLPTHRKTFRIMDDLGISDTQAVGHLVCLWSWALDNARDGRLPDSQAAIARAAHWTGEPESFVAALVAAGFIDRTDFGVALHSWYEHQGRHIERQERDSERKAEWRESGRGPDADRTRTGRGPDADRTRTGRGPDADVRWNATLRYATLRNNEEDEVTSATHVALQPVTKEKPKRKAGVNLAPLVDAFREAKLPDPVFKDPLENRAAQALMKLFAPAEIAGAWAAYDAGLVGNGWERGKTCFQLLARNNRVGVFLKGASHGITGASAQGNDGARRVAPASAYGGIRIG